MYILGGGREGYIFMEKSTGFEIGKLGNYAPCVGYCYGKMKKRLERVCQAQILQKYIILLEYEHLLRKKI